MSTKRIIEDKDFRRIVISTRRGARNITMHVKSDGLCLTVPPYSKTDKILAVVEKFRSELLERFRKVAARPLDFTFRIEADCFRLFLSPSHLKCFTVRKMPSGEVQLFCPENTDFEDEAVRKLVYGAVLRAMKKVAEELLPPLLDVWAERFGMNYRKVRITAARSRWGSCSSSGTISLSCYLMLLPSHLIDYVILHELAHTREMNHGPRFWELLDSMTGGQSLRLRAELRQFRPSL